MKQATTNTFGSLGYSAMLIQWLWTLVTIGIPIITSDIFKQLFLPPEPQEGRAPIFVVKLPDFMEITIAIVAVAFTLGIIIYALVTVPSTIGKGGQRITQKSSRVVTPHVIRHQKISKKKQRKIFERITWTFKGIFILLPLILLTVPPSASLGLTHEIVLVMGLIFGAFSLVFFIVQFILSRVWRIPAKQIW